MIHTKTIVGIPVPPLPEDPFPLVRRRARTISIRPVMLPPPMPERSGHGVAAVVVCLVMALFVVVAL